MNLKHILLVTSLLLGLSATAHAQPGAYPPPPPAGGGYYGPGYYPPPPPVTLERSGFTAGVGIGFGSMSDDAGPLECRGCSHSPVAGSFELHAGFMITPRLALLGEIWVTGQALDGGGYSTVVQSMLLLAAQYWITPQLWIKGGIGAAGLSISYDDGYASESEPVDDGGAIMGAIGYEILSSPFFAVDVQLRAGAGGYGDSESSVSAVALSLGLNWY